MPGASFRQGECSKVQPGDDGECPERSNQQFVKVIAGNILYDAPTALANLTFSVNELRANQKIARRPVLLTTGGIDSRGDSPSDGSAFMARDTQREKLPLFLENQLQRPQRLARIHAQGEIAGVIMGNLRKASHVEGKIVSQGGHADAKLAAAAACQQGQLFARGHSHDFGYFFRTTR